MTSYLLSRIIKRFFRHEHYSKYEKDKLGFEETNNFIGDIIRQGKPYLIARLGATESLGCGLQEMVNRKLLIKVPKRRKNELYQNAGMFSIDKNGLKRFQSIMCTSLSTVDAVCVWNIPFEEYLIKKYASKMVTKLTLTGMAGFLYSDPWTSHLKGKRVLVISPFAKSINNQYHKNRLKLFKNKRTLPPFELITLEAFNTVKGETIHFKTWDDALKAMCDSVDQVDFDIAIIGCGAYGLPIASHVKALGKIAIHTGGITQMLFGVKGKRWEEDPLYRPFINEFWIRPSENEKPKNASNIESSCYW